MKKILLIGCGAEIGALITGMIEPEQHGLSIASILTNAIAGDKKHPDMDGIDSLIARILLAAPHLLEDVSRDGDALVIKGLTIPVFWGDAITFDLSLLPQHYDLALVATSVKHIRDNSVMRRFESCATFVLGVAESNALPAIYPNLIGANTKYFASRPEPIEAARSFCLGSCQTNGWQAQLRAMLELADESTMTEFTFAAMEVDIIHPDTPTGRLGTKSINARDQDPRNNLRPSFSQMETSMDRLFPASRNINTVSLRTLTMPPGYQICRFFFRYHTESSSRLDTAAIADSFRDTARRLPHILHVAERPLGSRAFEFCRAPAVVLPQPALFHYHDDVFGLGDNPIAELISQAYVSNTRGYCHSVIGAMAYLLNDPKPSAFPASALNA